MAGVCEVCAKAIALLTRHGTSLRVCSAECRRLALAEKKMAKACAVCAEKPAPLKCCAGARYCSTSCQKRAWDNGHAKWCGKRHVAAELPPPPPPPPITAPPEHPCPICLDRADTAHEPNRPAGTCWKCAALVCCDCIGKLFAEPCPMCRAEPMKNYADAASRLEEAIAAHPEWRATPYKAFVLATLVYGDGRDPVKAERYLRIAARSSPDAMTNLGVVCLKRGEINEAFRWFERATARGNLTAKHNLGLMLYAKSTPLIRLTGLSMVHDAAAAGEQLARVTYASIILSNTDDGSLTRLGVDLLLEDMTAPGARCELANYVEAAHPAQARVARATDAPRVALAAEDPRARADFE